jgi:hypothetical protein
MELGTAEMLKISATVELFGAWVELGAATVEIGARGFSPQVRRFWVDLLRRH